MRRLLPPLLIASLLAACGPGDEGGPPGAATYRRHCAGCHGDRGQGSSMGLGPALKGHASEWDEASLLEYLRDPKTYAAKVERLGRRTMPALSATVIGPERAELLRYVLGLMR